MKRIIGLSLCLMLIVPAAFAGQISINGYLTQGVQLGGELLNNEKAGSVDDTYTFGKSRLKMTFTNDNIKGYVESDLATAAGTLKYVWAETKIGMGTLRVGKQAFAVSNWGGGLAGTSTFWGYANLYDNGMSYMTDIAGYKVAFANTTSLFADTPDNVISPIKAGYAVRVNKNIMGVDAGLFLANKADNDDSDWGMAIEASKAFGALLLQGQYWAEDKEYSAAAGAATITSLYATYDLGWGDVYLTQDMSGTTTEAKKNTSSQIGVDYCLAKNMMLNVNATGASVYNEASVDWTTAMGIQANF